MLIQALDWFKLIDSILEFHLEDLKKAETRTIERDLHCDEEMHSFGVHDIMNRFLFSHSHCSVLVSFKGVLSRKVF